MTTIAAVGGIEAVVAALQQHPANAHVQENCCGALLSFAIDDGNKTAVAAVTRLMVPPSITCIEWGAFRFFPALASVVLPKTLTSIDGSAFNGCSFLTRLDIPASVTWIGARAFSGCSALESILIPASVSNVGKHAFAGCTALTKVYIAKPKRTIILDGAFLGCTSLEHPPPCTKNGCWTCTKYAAYHPLGNKCEGCSKARYCDTVCEAIGWRVHGHREECSILRDLTAGGARRHVRVAPRYPSIADADASADL